MKNIQIIYWGFPLRFGNVKRFKENSAYFLVYKYAYWFGLWEMRKFMNKEESRKALKEYQLNEMK